ncbi:MAG TPA: thiamine pyrophosphate-dependent enzyme, partial [Flavobacteriaceae bacterium]|nr:thiamine pyrophosphate-dependent enzyme [Flavobacteriaceae bacterium]
MHTHPNTAEAITFEDFKTEVINDYKIAVVSRECSLLGRREVLTGKAKFGIFGDGKEVPQLAWAKVFRKGDFRSGYYRDQTFMMALDELTIEQFFAGLYAHTSLEADPMSAGRQMGGHFGTHSLDEQGHWKDLTQQYNSSADVSPTAAQMPRLLGLAQASKIYKNVKGIDTTNFSKNGNEIAWGSIGNASTSEGVFFETVNAAGVLQVPMVISIWDDEYGISVPAKYQTTKADISEILKGFQRDEYSKGLEILKVNGWDYVGLIETYQKAEDIAREEHVPVIIHVVELTQPQGHSTSGSHERYKSHERLAWEEEHDCNLKMREWMIANNIATAEDLDALEKTCKKEVREGQKRAWAAYLKPIKEEQQEALALLRNLANSSPNKVFIEKIINELKDIKEPIRKDVISLARKGLRYAVSDHSQPKEALRKWINAFFDEIQPKYSSHVYSESDLSTIHVKEVLPTYDEAKDVDARIILRDNFNALFDKYPEALIFGEDSGAIGDVNQGLEGLQKKYGKMRVADTGIREATIV